MFDSLSKAYAYLKENWNLFWNLKDTINRRLAEIQTLKQRALATKDQESLGRLIVAESQAKHSQREYEEMARKLNPFREYLSSSAELGLFPLWMAAGAASVAASLYVFMGKIRNEGAALDMIKRGMLSPTDARSILSGGGLSDTLSSASSLLMWGAAAYALFLFAPLLTKRG